MFFIVYYIVYCDTFLCMQSCAVLIIIVIIKCKKILKIYIFLTEERRSSTIKTRRVIKTTEGRRRCHRPEKVQSSIVNNLIYLNDINSRLNS